jgi:hypothetical protein
MNDTTPPPLVEQQAAGCALRDPIASEASRLADPTYYLANFKTAIAWVAQRRSPGFTIRNWAVFP